VMPTGSVAGGCSPPKGSCRISSPGRVLPWRRRFRIGGYSEPRGSSRGTASGPFARTVPSWIRSITGRLSRTSRYSNTSRFCSGRCLRSTIIGPWRGGKRVSASSCFGGEPGALKNWHGFPHRPDRLFSVRDGADDLAWSSWGTGPRCRTRYLQPRPVHPHLAEPAFRR
jgi:hypothetical protein